VRPLARLCAACLLALGCDASSSAPPITIGLSASVTGDLTAYTSDLDRIATLAFEEINQAGGVLGGRPLKVVVEDDQTTDDGAIAAYGALLSQKVSIVLGPRFSSGVIAVAPQIKDSMTLTLSPSATSARLTHLDTGGYFHRNVPSDVWQGVVLGQLVVDAGRKNLCLVHRNDAYGTGLADAMSAKVTALAPSTTLVRAPYDPSQTDLSHVLDPCDALKSQAMPGIALLSYTADGAVIINDAIRRGWGAVEHRFFMCDGNRDPMLLSQISDPSIIEGALGTNPSGPDTSTAEGAVRRGFFSRFTARYNGAPLSVSSAGNMYDSAYIAAMAIELAGGITDRVALKNALGSMASGTIADGGDWAAIKRAIKTGKSVNYQGAAGAASFDLSTSDVRPPYYYAVWSVVGGVITDQRVVTLTQ
jgi:branched-chain amino acid transport system substrate-binding protein